MITKDKEYTTRDGHEVRIYATDCSGGYPIHGAILYDGEWVIRTWTINGKIYIGESSEEDLIEKQKEHTVKVAFWKDYEGLVHTTVVKNNLILKWVEKEDVLAIKEITFKEGEGL